MIVDEVTNSKYLKEKIKELNIIMFHSMLTDYDFRQDYITMIFKEYIIEELNNKIHNMKIIMSNDNIEINNQNIIKNQIENYTFLNGIIENVMIKSSEFTKLLEIKKKCIENEDIRYVIPITSVENLFDLPNKNKIIEFKRCVLLSITNKINIKSNDVDNILLSWEDINNILLKFNKSSSITDMLLLYYIKIDRIYESINKKISSHNTRIISSEIDYNIYTNRIKEKQSYEYKKLLTSIEKSNEISKCGYDEIEKLIKKANKFNIKKTSETIVYKEVIIDADYDKIIQSNLEEKHALIEEEFKKIKEKVDQMQISVIDDTSDIKTEVSVVAVANDTKTTSVEAISLESYEVGDADDELI